MTVQWSENWNRSYRVTIGVREYVKSEYKQYLDSIPSSIIRPKLASDEQTIPSDAVIISNLEEDGFDRRGFSFQLDSVQRASAQGSEGEKSVVTLYNLDDRMIDLINKENCIIIVESGYQGKVTLAYTGDIVKSSTQTRGQDKIYTLQCASGASAMKNTLASLHYDEEVSEQDVIIDMVGRFPATALGSYGLSETKDRYKTGGRNFVGQHITNFDNVMARNNLSYAHFNGKIVIIPFRLKGEDYDHFARTNYNLTLDTIKAISDISAKTGVGSSDKASKLRELQINTFYAPIEIGQFVTIPDEPETKGYAGTYQVTGRRLILNSKGSAWDVVLQTIEVG